MTTSDPYDVQGLLKALAKVRPDLAPTLAVSRAAHSRNRFYRPPGVRKADAARRARRQARCDAGHFLPSITATCLACWNSY